jgi:predicted DNA-binding protein (UPF0251 family)
MNEYDLGRQGEDRILITEEEILREIENQPSIQRLANQLGISQFVVWCTLKKQRSKVTSKNFKH